MSRLRTLLVDDDPLIINAFKRHFDRAGHDAATAESASAALDLFRSGSFDVVVSDIAMPGLSGIDFLREIRKQDLDVPVILMTGRPTITSAISAVDLGAFSYLEKPFDMHKLFQAIERAAALHRLALVKREALSIIGADENLLGDRTSLEQRFTSALSLAHLVFQPIVSTSKSAVFAYEALLRTTEPTLGNPIAFLRAAERLKREHALGRVVRKSAALAVSSLPEPCLLFVNLHPLDLLDDDLVAADAPLSACARRVVLEITERASLEEMAELPARLSALRALGFRIAIDDLGAGYAGLTSLTTLEPDIVKIDMSLVRGVASDERRKRVVRSILDLCGSLSIDVVTEGVETFDERDTLRALGSDLMQGYHFAKPDKSFVTPRI